MTEKIADSQLHFGLFLCLSGSICEVKFHPDWTLMSSYTLSKQLSNPRGNIRPKSRSLKKGNHNQAEVGEVDVMDGDEYRRGDDKR